MTIRPYEASDWEAVREIYDLSKPDEMRGGVDIRAIVPLGQDPSGLELFRDSVIFVADDAAAHFAGDADEPIAELFDGLADGGGGGHCLRVK